VRRKLDTRGFCECVSLPARFFFLPFFGVLAEEGRLLVLVSRSDSSMLLET
jgi:hypothetical protein